MSWKNIPTVKPRSVAAVEDKKWPEGILDFTGADGSPLVSDEYEVLAGQWIGHSPLSIICDYCGTEPEKGRVSCKQCGAPLRRVPIDDYPRRLPPAPEGEPG